MFKILALPLLAYVIHAVNRGAVFAKSGMWGRTFHRDEDPLSYWSAVVAYAVLALAMFFWF